MFRATQVIQSLLALALALGGCSDAAPDAGGTGTSGSAGTGGSGGTGGNGGTGGSAGSSGTSGSAGDAGTGAQDDGGPDGAVPDAAPDAEPDAGLDAEAGATCGDGQIEAPESCDDSNTQPGDGCDAACQIERQPGDACPGSALTLTGTGTAPRTATVQGSTIRAVNDTESRDCGGATAPDVVYSFTPDITGTARVTATTSFPAVVALRTSCDAKTSELACDETIVTTGGTLDLRVAVSNGVPAFLVVDGYGGLSGDFQLNLQIDPSTCGNGAAEAPESCDDGNTVAGDGCSASCALERPGVAAACPGLPFTFKGSGLEPRRVSVAGDTSKLDSPVSASSDVCRVGIDSGTAAENAVHALTADVDGSLEVRLNADYSNALVYARRECNASRVEADCAASVTASTPMTLRFPVRKGVTSFVFVDGGKAVNSGPYVLDATLSPARCGNGVLDGGEACDDGNAVPGDGCDVNCVIEPVPSDVCPGAELVLAGTGTQPRIGRTTGSTLGYGNDFFKCGASASAFRPDAVYRVQAEITGRLRVTASAEHATLLAVRTDCGLDTTESGCVTPKGYGPTTTIVPVVAGEDYFVIVDGESEQKGPFLLEAELTPAVCGNRLLDGGETCDDGNTAGGDGCDGACALEPSSPVGDSCASPYVAALTQLGADSWSGTFTGGTTNKTSAGNFGAACATPGKDVFYSLTVPADGVLRAALTTQVHDATLGWREVCPPSTGATGVFFCTDALKAPGTERFTRSVVAGQTLFLVIDASATTSSGAYQLDLELGPPACGDGLLGAGEGCDDGNRTAGDGCDASCALEVLPTLDACPGTEWRLVGTAPESGKLTLSTAGLSAQETGSCGGSGPDGVVKLTPATSGTLSVRTNGNFASVLYVRSDCSDAISEPEDACDATGSSLLPNLRELELAVVGGRPVFLFIDGLAGASGVVELEATVVP